LTSMHSLYTLCARETTTQTSLEFCLRNSIFAVALYIYGITVVISQWSGLTRRVNKSYCNVWRKSL